MGSINNKYKLFEPPIWRQLDYGNLQNLSSRAVNESMVEKLQGLAQGFARIGRNPGKGSGDGAGKVDFRFKPDSQQ